MVRKNNDKKVKINGRKMDNRNIIQRNVSPVKIAYYVQRLLEKNMETKEIILIISSQFGNGAVKEFAKMYRYCYYMEDIRRIANLIYNIPKKNMDGAMDKVVHNILIKKEILSSKYMGEHSHSLGQKKIDIKVL